MHQKKKLFSPFKDQSKHLCESLKAIYTSGTKETFHFMKEALLSSGSWKETFQEPLYPQVQFMPQQTKLKKMYC